MDPLRIFIGYDPRETVAFHVLAHSIVTRASIPVAITPIISRTIPVFQRPRDPGQSTDFSFTRFLVPYLSGYMGYSVFMDSDMLCLTDIADLVATTDQQSAVDVLVCQHDYTPRATTKFLGQPQKAYPRKNWSSLIVFRNSTFPCRRLTPKYVNEASAADLHRFAWCEDHRIGTLPLSWNYLVDEPNQDQDPPKIVHWTQGGPWFPEYANAEHADAWFRERRSMNGC